MKRLLCLLLAAVMILSFAACANGGDDDPNESSTGEASSEEETGDLSFVDELPALDFADQEIHLIGGGRITNDDELSCVPTNGELINDAVYERNCSVEGRLHVKFDVTKASGTGTNGSVDYYIGDLIHKLVTTGDNEYQIVGLPSYVGMQTVIKGDYRDLGTSEYLDLSKSYWAQGYNDMASWGEGHQYLASGAAALTMYRYMYVTLYNKDIMVDQQIEDPYETALNGEWTIDRQAALKAGVYKDLNGNGKQDDKDYYGFVGGSATSGDCYWVGSDAHVIQKDESGLFFYDPDVGRLDAVMDTVLNLYYTDGSFIFSGAEDSTDVPNIITMFDEGRAMMVGVMIGKIETDLRSFAGDYGILPQPKYDTMQPDYRTCVQDQVTGFGIPTTVPAEQLDMTSAVLECLASESYKHVVPAYYNTALSYRYLNNAESVVMLDLTYRSVAFEIAQIYTACLGSNDLNFLEIMRAILTSKKNTVSSKYKSINKAMNKALNNVNKNYQKVVDGAA